MLISFHNVIYNLDHVKNITLDKEKITFRLYEGQECLAIYETAEGAKEDFDNLAAGLARASLLRNV